MSVNDEITLLPTGRRILHLITKSSGVITAVAEAAIQGQLSAGYHVAVAGRSGILNRISAPAGVDESLLAKIPLPVIDALTPADARNAFILHKYYRHVDVVHAHGLHAAAVAGLGMTGLPARFRPALVATVGRFNPNAVLDAAAAKIVSTTAAVVLGTTGPVVERFRDEVPVVERAGLPHADVKTIYEPNRDREHTRADLGLSSGTWVIASALRLSDHTALATVLDVATTMRTYRPDRRTVVLLSGSGGDRKRIKEAFDHRDLGVRVVDEIDTADVLGAADVVIAGEKMTGIDDEGLMQLGRPVVFIGSERSHRPWGDAAVRVADDDSAALRQEINRLLDSPAARGAAGVAARRRVVDVDRAELLTEDLLSLYNQALDCKR